MMLPSSFYLPETIERMDAVYKRIIQELKMEHASIVERERLANCILDFGNITNDLHRLLDRSVRLYLRSAAMNRRSRMSINSRHGRGTRNTRIGKTISGSLIRPIFRRYD